MKTHTFSIVVGTRACNFKCPFCVSKMTCRSAKKHDINWNRFDIACRIAEQARDGLVNAMFTGTGEPTLFPDDITDMLHIMNKRFPLVTLQTNGALLTQIQLNKWAALGLTGVCLSVADYDHTNSNKLMGMEGLDYNFWAAVDMIHEAGLMVRLNCTMVKGGVANTHAVENLITVCKDNEVEQLTLREVDRPGNPAGAPEVADWVDAHKPDGFAKELFNYLTYRGGNRLPDLPHGGVVFDYRDQNVCISNCLTESRDPNDIRQIIFFPNGEISYDWKYKGARIL